MGAPHDWRTTGAPCGRRSPPGGHGGREQCVELLESVVERDQLVAALDQEVLSKLVTAVHLEHEAAEVAEAVLTGTQERTTLAA